MSRLTTGGPMPPTDMLPSDAAAESSDDAPSGDGSQIQASDEELVQSLRHALSVPQQAQDPQAREPSKPSMPPTPADNGVGHAGAVSGGAPSRRWRQQAAVSEAAPAVADEILAAVHSTAKSPPKREPGPGGRAR